MVDAFGAELHTGRREIVLGEDMKRLPLFSLPLVRGAGSLLLMVCLCAPAARGAMSLGFQKTGQLGYELVGFGQASTNFSFNGNVFLGNMPPGAVIEYAAIYTNDFNPGGGAIDISLTDPAMNTTGVVSNQLPTSQSPVTGGLAFGWEIPLNPLSIIGNGQYTISISPNALFGNASQMAGAGLLVVFSDPTLPQSTVTVMHGAEYLDASAGFTSASVSFSESGGSTIGVGSGQLSVMTFADDAFDPPMSPNELVQFNGTTVHTGLDGNLNPNASIVTTGVSTLAGNNANSATVTAGGDIFSWHVAVLQSPVPEPGSVLLLVLSAGVCVIRRHR
jgi:hypothetical protein